MGNRKMVKVWSVLVALPGCLPDSDPELYDSEELAYERLKELEEELEEDGERYYQAEWNGPFLVDPEQWEEYQNNGMYPEII